MPISKIGSKGVKDAELTADDLAPGTITNAKLADATIENAKLAGSIANDKLANSSVTLNGTAVSLGGTADIGTQWQAEKTASFTAVAGEGYFINTTGGAVTVTLPASPSVGDEVDIVDSRGQFNTNSVTVNRNSSNIEGSAANATLNNVNTKKKYVYSGATQGWIAVNNEVPEPEFISATGGTETTSGSFKIHTFASSGNFVVSSLGNQGAEVSYLVVAGGGGAGTNHGAGGGAGGFREGRSSNDSYTISPLNAPAGITATVSTYPITVGGGGSGGADSNDGSNSVFSTITSAGGGQGGSNNDPPHHPGGPGGSGGGSKNGATVGSGNTPPVSPPQGSNGGQGHPGDNGAGGGGGATAVGTPGASQPGGGPGGAGATTHISGSPVAYAGGGGGNAQSGPEGTGGSGGGGNASQSSGSAGTTNTGGGGGASVGNGGSGIVVLRYKNAE